MEFTHSLEKPSSSESFSFDILVSALCTAANNTKHGN
jgi:hypothetical protein